MTRRSWSLFLLTPLREGRRTALRSLCSTRITISTHAPAGGATRSQKSAPSDAIFLLTPLREGRLESAITGVAKTTISTHAPAGGATVAFAMARTVQSPFLLTPLREGRRSDFSASSVCFAISTHAPAGGATSKTGRRVCRVCDFYSRPCGRGDAQNKDLSIIRRISTHAPAGGATAAKIWPGSKKPISTHAPAGGATTPSASLWRPPPYFYSRPCGRGDVFLR